MATYSSGINAILARMETNPAEFFGDAPKWRFIFKENFREILTEPEKGALHEKLKEVRRQEFDHIVMRTLLDDQMQGAWGTSEKGAIAGGLGVTGGIEQAYGRAITNGTGIFQNQTYDQNAQNRSALQNNSGGLLGSLGSAFK
jgi:hypothetical protein